MPPMAWALVLKVCTAEPAVKVPLQVIPPLNVIASSAELFQVAPLLIVTRPPKVSVPVVEDMINVPLVPFPTVVLPVTVKL